MIDLLHNLALGFGVALSPMNLGLCLIGALVGTLIGVLPGVGPLATIAMLLPITFGLPPVGALIMLAGIYYGAQYGGSTTSILINIPGESSSVVTALDGHQMARQGRAGPALAIAAIGSFIAGTFGTMLIAVAGPPLAELALKFGAPEYFSLMLMGLVAAAVLAQGDMMKSLAMVAMGLASFCSDLTMPISWNACVEIGRRYTATLSGTMNMLGNLAGFVAPVGGGLILSRAAGDWNVLIYLMVGASWLAAVCWIFLDPGEASSQVRSDLDGTPETVTDTNR